MPGGQEAWATNFMNWSTGPTSAETGVEVGGEPAIYCETGPLPEGFLWPSICTHAVFSTLVLDKVLSIYKILLQATQNGGYNGAVNWPLHIGHLAGSIFH